MAETDRQALWEKALGDSPNEKLLECLKAHVEIEPGNPKRLFGKARKEAVAKTIAEEVVKIYNQLWKDRPPKPLADDMVLIDASIIGKREAELIKCIVEAIPLRCRIIQS